MSARTVYTVIVRMLYDPAFASRVYLDPAGELAGEDLSAAERGWLVACDPRAYRTDPMRRLRTLTALLEEFPASAAYALRRGREGSVRPEMEILDAFFSSSSFHACVREGRGMVDAFADFLREGSGGALPDARVAALAGLEVAVARVRRASTPQAARPDVGPGRVSAPGAAASGPATSGQDDPRLPATSREDDPRLRLAAHALVLSLPAGTYELHRRITRTLENAPRPALACLTDPRWSLPVLLELGPDEETLLVERASNEEAEAGRAAVRHATITPELYGLLNAAASGPALRSELVRKARELGAEPGEAEEVVSGLREEGLLVRE